MDQHVAALTQSLAMFALHRRDFTAARQLFEALAQHRVERGDQEGLASVYHQLGLIAEEQRDFAAAGAWFLKSVGLFAKANDPHYLNIVVAQFLKTLQAADGEVQAVLRQGWQDAGLDRIAALDDLERQWAQQQRGSD